MIGKKLLADQTLLALAAIMTIFGLALMVWSLVQPTPMPVILAMSVGQGLGTLAFLLYGFVVLRDIRGKKPPE
jgi:hypothetical protein